MTRWIRARDGTWRWTKVTALALVILLAGALVFLL